MINQLDKEYEKFKRVIWLKRQVRNRPSKKDPADILEQVKKEIEGDKPLIDNSQHTHLTKIELKVFKPIVIIKRVLIHFPDSTV